MNIKKYNVLLVNDPFTPLEFVINNILIEIFNLDKETALQIASYAEINEKEVVSRLPMEEAEFKVEKSQNLARKRGFPLTLEIDFT